jgi:hypothetical protein
LANQGNLGRITGPIYFLFDNKAKEMFEKVVITMQVPQAHGAFKSQAKIGGFYLALNMTIVLGVHALHFSKMACWKINWRQVKDDVVV